MSISLMMVTYNRLELTKKTLENLCRSIKIPHRLIVVDNGSNDGTVEFLDSLDQSSTIIYKYPSNMGIAAGRNRGLLIADEIGTDWYCTIDNDIDVPDGWLEECIDILKANSIYGMIGVNMEGVKYPIVELNGKRFQDKPAGNLGTACMVFRKQVHQAIGFFKKYNKYGLEDSDAGMRARVFGFKLGYIERMGTHLGVGELDTGEYRKFKTREHDSRVKEFQNNCSLYHARKLPIYVKYSE